MFVDGAAVAMHCRAALFARAPPLRCWPDSAHQLGVEGDLGFEQLGDGAARFGLAGELLNVAWSAPGILAFRSGGRR